jgi:ferredoxin/flavodoxin
MILYFSGTGNSRYAAQVIQSVTGDEIRSMNDLIKRGSTEAMQSGTPFVFVAPSYCGRIPRIVDSFIAGARFEGSTKAYFVMTCGDTVGDSAKYIRALCARKGFAFMGLGAAAMPENYITMYPTPDAPTAKAEVERATPRIAEIARLIQAGLALSTDKTLTSRAVMSNLVNPLFYRLVVSAKGFHATDTCTGCGTCVRSCPLNNVALADGRPRWGKSCTHCMACICGCPAEAIEYGNKTRGKPRYFNTGFQGRA